MGIFQLGIFWVGTFGRMWAGGGKIPGASLIGGNFLCGTFPDKIFLELFLKPILAPKLKLFSN